MTTRPPLKAITDAVDSDWNRVVESKVTSSEVAAQAVAEREAAEAAEAAVKQSADLRERHAQLARQDAANAVLAAILRRQTVPFFSATDAQLVHVFGEALIAVQTAAAVSGVVGGGQ